MITTHYPQPHIDLPESASDEHRRRLSYHGGEVGFALHVAALHGIRLGQEEDDAGGVASAIRALTSALRQRASGAPVWLDAPAAVKHMGLPSAKALYQFTRRGIVPAHRLGRRLRFSRDELDAVLRSEAFSCTTARG